MQRLNKLEFLYLSLIGLILVLCAGTATAQSSGGIYTIEQSVVAPGQVSVAGGAISIAGAIGQPAAGTRSVAPALSLTGGFWTAAPARPTAALVEIGGRVTTSNGQGLMNARVIVTAQNGEQRTALTGSFGYYRFDGIESGQMLVIEIKSRRYSFAPQVAFISSAILELNFVAEQPAAK